MARNIDRNNLYFNEALEILSSTETEGAILSKLDGEFQLFIHTYSDDVDVQQRVAAVDAVLDADGNEVIPAKAASSWVTIKTFTEVGSEDWRMTRNYEYRLQTATAGSVVYLDVQWGAVV